MERKESLAERVLVLLLLLSMWESLRSLLCSLFLEEKKIKSNLGSKRTIFIVGLENNRSSAVLLNTIIFYGIKYLLSQLYPSLQSGYNHVVVNPGHSFKVARKSSSFL